MINIFWFFNKIHLRTFHKRGCRSERTKQNMQHLQHKICILKPLGLWLLLLLSTRAKGLSCAFVFWIKCNKLWWVLSFLSLKQWQKDINICPELENSFIQTQRGWVMSSGWSFCYKLSQSLSHPCLSQVLKYLENWRTPLLDVESKYSKILWALHFAGNKGKGTLCSLFFV